MCVCQTRKKENNFYSNSIIRFTFFHTFGQWSQIIFAKKKHFWPFCCLSKWKEIFWMKINAIMTVMMMIKDQDQTTQSTHISLNLYLSRCKPNQIKLLYKSIICCCLIVKVKVLFAKYFIQFFWPFMNNKNNDDDDENLFESLILVL